MTEVKLTVEQARKLYDLAAPMRPFEGFLADGQDCGLIAEEPVDPLLVEVDPLLSTYWDTEWDTRDLALAALRRGREIGLAERPQLTREMVREAVRLVYSDIPTTLQRSSAFHAALTEQVQQRTAACEVMGGTK